MKKTFLVLLTLMILASLAMPVLAADGIQLQGLSDTGGQEALVTKLTNVINAVAGFAGLACVGALVFFGIKLAVHSEQETEVAKIKSRMMYALMGLGIVLLSWLVVGYFANIVADGGQSGAIPSSSYVAMVDRSGDYI